MNNELILEKLETLQKYINKETSHILLNSKKSYITDMFSNIKEMIQSEEIKYPIHECCCGNQKTCDCISDPHDNDEWGEMIPLPNSRMATKEEIEKWNKIKLPF